jgi:hypothetical protein
MPCFPQSLKRRASRADGSGGHAFLAVCQMEIPADRSRPKPPNSEIRKDLLAACEKAEERSRSYENTMRQGPGGRRNPGSRIRRPNIRERKAGNLKPSGQFAQLQQNQPQATAGELVLQLEWPCG